MAGGQVRLLDLVKRFADVTAVDGINLDMPPGEFFSLLGPSGCGKTTTLRLIAGFERPDEGQILLDEPLGALDAKLRKALQIELKALQEEVGITFVYVTHDQEEALTMSDRLAVMSNGRVEQIGTPSEVYEEPQTAYVADFLGVSNLMEARAEGSDGDGRCRVRLGEFELTAGQGERDARGDAKIVIRPERVRLEDAGTAGANRVPGMVERVVYVGSTRQVIVHLAPGGTLQVWVQNQGEGSLAYQQGSAVTVHLPAEALRVLQDAVVATA